MFASHNSIFLDRLYIILHLLFCLFNIYTSVMLCRPCRVTKREWPLPTFYTSPKNISRSKDITALLGSEIIIPLITIYMQLICEDKHLATRWDDNRNIIFIPEDNISFSAAFVFKCDLIVCLNNLIYQLAILLGRPVVGLFETGETSRWAFVQKKQHEIISDKRLKNIQLNDVVARAREILSNR